MKVFSSNVRFCGCFYLFIFRNILLNFFSLCFFAMSGFFPSPLLPSFLIFNFITLSLVIVTVHTYHSIIDCIPLHLFSHSPIFSPLATISMIYFWVCFCLVCSFVVVFRFHIQVKPYSISFLWLILLGIILSRSIHVVANDKISFFFISE